MIDAINCKGCSLCVVACPTKVIALAEDVNAKGYNYAMVKFAAGCTGCANCAMVCPDSCIVVYRQKEMAITI